MVVTVQLFASLKDTAGSTAEIEVEEPVTVARLMASFIARYPSLKGAERSLNVAVDQTYALPDQVILPDQEVAIFPPVSGG